MTTTIRSAKSTHTGALRELRCIMRSNRFSSNTSTNSNNNNSNNSISNISSNNNTNNSCNKDISRIIRTIGIIRTSNQAAKKGVTFDRRLAWFSQILPIIHLTLHILSHPLTRILIWMER